jgi:hypothetical protein
MFRTVIAALFLFAALPTLAQFITDDANAVLHVYWDTYGIQDTKANAWGETGTVTPAGAEFGYSAGAEGFTSGDWYFNGSNDPQPSWNPPYSVMDFTADECAYDPWICGSPSFTGVLAFKNTGGDTNPGTRFLLSTPTLGTGNGWYLYTQSFGTPPRERLVSFYSPGLMWPAPPRAQDNQGIVAGDGLQVICFGVTADLEPAIKANGRAIVTGPAGDWQDLCDPPTGAPECISAFIPSYGPGYLGIHDGFGTQWRPATDKTYYEFYITRTPITSTLCEDLEAEIRGE